MTKWVRPKEARIVRTREYRVLFELNYELKFEDHWGSPASAYEIWLIQAEDDPFTIFAETTDMPYHKPLSFYGLPDSFTLPLFNDFDFSERIQITVMRALGHKIVRQFSNGR